MELRLYVKMYDRVVVFFGEVEATKMGINLMCRMF